MRGEEILKLFAAGAAGVFASEFVASTAWHQKIVSEYQAKEKTTGQPILARVARFGAAAGAIGLVAMVMGSIKAPKTA